MLKKMVTELNKINADFIPKTNQYILLTFHLVLKFVYEIHNKGLSSSYPTNLGTFLKFYSSN